MMKKYVKPIFQKTKYVSSESIAEGSPNKPYDAGADFYGGIWAELNECYCENPYCPMDSCG